MKLLIIRNGDTFSVEGEWQDARHRSRQMADDLTKEAQDALTVLMAWADTCEETYRIDSIAYDDKRRLEAERDELQSRIDALSRKAR